ncbi:hypothetical protein GCK32_021141 [Trichostrongylus colubriformis]|uniref:Secreted protein n=1 Tax=Trichostrongylus colubriformis TaxID=6319 RepID=A0AAN8G370_TRICO
MLLSFIHHYFFCVVLYYFILLSSSPTTCAPFPCVSFPIMYYIHISSAVSFSYSVPPPKFQMSCPSQKHSPRSLVIFVLQC